jgi:putative aldouronate transport system permease protein
MWKGVGFGMVLYLSTLLGISVEYYEAARIDGASKWQQIKYITLPLLKPTMITMVILGISKIFNSDFGLFYQVPRNSGVLYPVTQTVDTYVYNALMNQNNIMMSSAASVAQAFIGFVLILVSNKVIAMISPDDALF